MIILGKEKQLSTEDSTRQMPLVRLLKKKNKTKQNKQTKNKTKQKNIISTLLWNIPCSSN